ncbi:ubiquitin-associated protein 1 isoform X3 [Anabrus simplex]|uniref:ubiquitin-associated protein 1 isoform X3 n=1 Tax=Anabrus simplex TaxID=316456 RepID=UPI0034DD9445
MIAMSHHVRESEKQAFSYMDGVSVKIAENFKPPRKIALSVGFQHRFPVESGAEEYDFKLEHSVLSKMGEWRKLRQAEVAARKERIKAQDAAWEERFSKQLQNFALGPSSTEAASTVGSSSKTYSSPTDQDVPSRSLSRSVPDIVEELEKELTEKKIADTNAVAARASHTPPPRPNSFGSTGLENWKPWPDLDSPEQSQSKGKKSPVKKLPVSSLPNPFHKLSPEGQQLTRHISEMGFALPRVARACVALHEDGKKVVEFLLQVQSLEETWPGDQAENALLLNECDYPRAVKYLEALTQLLDLGFPEDKVSQALVMFNNDRDKALDHIIS